MELLSLPRDILGEIIGFVSVTDLPSLHLTSKEVSSLTYEFFSGRVINPTMTPKERFKYKAIKDEYINTQCYVKDCDNNSKGFLFCLECMKKRNQYWDVDIFVCGYEDGKIETIYIFTYKDLNICFTWGKYHMTCRGLFIPTTDLLSPLTPEQVLSHLRGHKYEFPSIQGKIRNKRCNYTTPLVKKPLIMNRCNHIIRRASASLFYPDFCDFHNRYFKGHCSEEEISGALIAHSEEDSTYQFIGGELKGLSFVMKDSWIPHSYDIPKELCEKYGIKYP